MAKSMRFRPCIDLHNGKVKQIVGSTLSDSCSESVEVNFTSENPPSFYASLYRKDSLPGGHVIMLGPGSEAAAKEALQSWPDGLQVGGGINTDNAKYWLDQGASHIIVTSWVFHNGMLDRQRLENLVKQVGKQRLVLDLSCRKQNGHYFVVTDRWQRFTTLKIAASVLDDLSHYCDEFLIHAVDVEGKNMGLDIDLISILARHLSIPTTYAGGISSADDLEQLQNAGKGVLDFTVGSALDIFGGSGLRYQDMVDSYGK